jgi:hypothetical protein
VYTVKFAGAVYVLHAFQKKLKTRGKTRKADLDRIRGGCGVCWPETGAEAKRD